jgi:hypothetical protein
MILRSVCQLADNGLRVVDGCKNYEEMAKTI